MTAADNTFYIYSLHVAVSLTLKCVWTPGRVASTLVVANADPNESIHRERFPDKLATIEVKRGKEKVQRSTENRGGVWSQLCVCVCVIFYSLPLITTYNNNTAHYCSVHTHSQTLTTIQLITAAASWTHTGGSNTVTVSWLVAMTPRAQTPARGALSRPPGRYWCPGKELAPRLQRGYSGFQARRRTD